MSHVALTVLAPVAPGRGPALAQELDALPEGDGSPLAGVPGLHMGRLALVDRLEVPPGSAATGLGPLLLLCVDADGPRPAVEAALARTCGRFLTACEGCPDPGDHRAFGRWLRRHRVRDRWTIMPYAGRTVAEVRAGLEARRRLGAFAVAAHDRDPGALRRAFLAEFGS